MPRLDSNPCETPVAGDTDGPGREQNLAEFVALDPLHDEFRNHDQQVRLYGDAALIVGITSIRGRADGKASTADFRYTDMWIRQDGQWLPAAGHASSLPWVNPEFPARPACPAGPAIPASPRSIARPG